MRSAVIVSYFACGLAFGGCSHHPATVPIVDGLGSPDSLIFQDLGPADVTAPVRSLLAFPIQNEAGLDAALTNIYDPTSSTFRAYLTPETWIAAYAPSQDDVNTVQEWLQGEDYTVSYVASNRLLLEFDGTVGQFNTTFGVTLDLMQKIVGSAGFQYGTLETLHMDADVAPLIAAVLTADEPADTTKLPIETGTIVTTPPAGVESSLTPAQVAHAYGADIVYAAGHTGEGVTLGVIGAATFKFKDLQSFWQSFGIFRADPQVEVMTDPIATRHNEITTAVEWAGALAPGSPLIIYEGPDTQDTSLIYAFNDAVGAGEAQILVDTYSHHESSEAAEVRWQYQRSAKMAAALGMSVVVASGDTNGADTPSSAWWVVAVGGTTLSADGSGNLDFTTERVWDLTGEGESLTIPAPPWQTTQLPHGRRGMNDLAMVAGPSWDYFLDQWIGANLGTAYSAAAFAGLLATVQSARTSRGAPPIGCLNPLLYSTPTVQQSFRDITTGSTLTDAAGAGWDLPSGWGVPQADQLDLALP